MKQKAEIYIIIIFFFFLQSYAFAQNYTLPDDIIKEQLPHLEKDKDDINALIAISRAFLYKQDYENSIKYINQLENTAIKLDNTKATLYAYCWKGQVLTVKGMREESLQYLNKAITLAEKTGCDSILYSAYNGLGLLYSNDYDYYMSLNYYFKALEIAKRFSNEEGYSIILSNIAEVYYYKKDPDGLKFAQECYERGKSFKNAMWTELGAYTLSLIYYIKGDYDKALKYIKETLYLAIHKDFYDMTGLYCDYANILLKIGEIQQAEDNYMNAIANIATSNPASISHTYLSYGKYLMGNGQTEKALVSLFKGLDVCVKNNHRMHLAETYQSISLCYDKLGKKDKALNFYKLFHDESLRYFNVDKENHINELKIRYDVATAENMKNEAEVKYLRSRYSIVFLICCIVILIIIALSLLLLFYNKNKLYRSIVMQVKSNQNKKYLSSSLSIENGEMLFASIEKAMKEEKCFTDSYLTLENFAKHINTNRSYLSQIINEKTGLSFQAYVKSIRIEEAIRILSDPNDKTPIKALAAELGFGAISSFYRDFNEALGIPPSTYRKYIVLMSKEKTSSSL